MARKLIIAALLVSFSAQVRSEEISIDNVLLPKSSLSAKTKVSPQSGTHVWLDTLSIIDFDDARALLGKGFDVFKGEVLAEAPCIEANGNDGGFGSGGIKRTREYQFSDTVSGITAHNEASGTSANFGITYKLISASAATGTDSESYFNSSDQFGRVYHRIVTRGEWREAGKWSKDAYDKLLHNKKAFLEKCGTHYIQSIYYGHLLDETLRFSLRNEAKKSSSADSLSFGVKDLLNFGVTGTNQSTSVNTLSTTSDIKRSRGALTIQQPVPKDADGVKALVDYSKYDFPTAVAKSTVDQADILYIDVRPYSERQLPKKERIPSWPEKVFELMTAKTSMIQDLTTAISTLNYAKSLGEKNYGALYDAKVVAFGDLDKKLEPAMAAKRKFREAIDDCHKLMIADKDNNGGETCNTALDKALTKATVDAALITRLH